MEKLISNWSNVQSVPEDYIFPLETRPREDLKIPVNNIPIIDLNEAQNGDRDHITQQIIKAAQEFGFFQVHTKCIGFSLKTMITYFFLYIIVILVFLFQPPKKKNLQTFIPTYFHHKF